MFMIRDTQSDDHDYAKCFPTLPFTMILGALRKFFRHFNIQAPLAIYRLYSSQPYSQIYMGIQRKAIQPSYVLVMLPWHHRGPSLAGALWACDTHPLLLHLTCLCGQRAFVTLLTFIFFIFVLWFLIIPAWQINLIGN